MTTRKEIAVARVAAEDALTALDNAVKGRFSVGDQVEYEHGGKWIGPRTIEMVRSTHNAHGPLIRVSNNKTCKVPPPLSVDRIRRIGEDWGNPWDALDLLEETRAERTSVARK